MINISGEDTSVPVAELTGQWGEALEEACKAGQLEVVKWLVDHPCGWQAISDMRTNRYLYKLLSLAAQMDHTEVMKYLYERDAAVEFDHALVDAIRFNRMESVKWLLEHFPETEDIPDYCLMDEAARRGRVAMLHLFQNLGSSGALGVFPAGTLRLEMEEEDLDRGSNGTLLIVEAADRYRNILENVDRYRAIWASTDPMDDAAANGEIQAVKWLHENRQEGCTTAAMDSAAANGHLEVVKWLHDHRSEGCTLNAMDFAAANGHLEVVKWLQANTTAGATTKAIDLAAEGGHLSVLRWLFANRSEGCTIKAIEKALSNGYLRVACWLQMKVPELVLTEVNVLSERNKFDMLLYLHTHYPGVFTLLFVLNARQPVPGRRAKATDLHVMDWLAQHYPTPDISDEEEEDGFGLEARLAGHIMNEIATQFGGAFGGQMGHVGRNDVIAMNNMVVIAHHDNDDEGEDEEADENIHVE